MSAISLIALLLLLLSLLNVDVTNGELVQLQNEGSFGGGNASDGEHQNIEGIYRLGVQYFISRGDLYALEITTNNASLLNLTPINRDVRHRNISNTNNPFLVPEIGSGGMPILHEAPLFQDAYVYTVYHHHAYIAVGQDIIELLLNSKAPNYHRISVGHTPLQVEAQLFGGDIYLYVLYEIDGSGYVAIYRKYNSGRWSKQGQHDVLVYSPRWFNRSEMSNVIFFAADDLHYSYKVTYIAVASGYTVYFREILDGSDFTIDMPEPCNKIVSIKFNEVKQSMFVVCTNVTFYFNYLEYELLSSGIWNRTGLVTFSQDGQIAAIQTNHSGGMTTITVHGLNFRPSTEEERVYEFHHFHHVASRSLIIMEEFVTVSRNNHFYCYIEMVEYGIVCIDVERALGDVRRDGIISDATFLLPHSRTVLCWSRADCPVMYSHKELLVVMVQQCEKESPCTRLAMIYNMSTVENIANITDISLDMLVYKSDTQPILLSPPLNLTQPLDISIVLPTSTFPSQPVTMAFSSTPQPTHDTMLSPTTTPVETTTIPGNGGGGGGNGADSAYLLEVCEYELLATNTAYSRLLIVTITLCICFCIAMLVTVLLLVGLVCCNRKGKQTKP